MQEFLSLPHPSLREIAISAQLLIILWPVRVMARAIETEARQERRKIISKHVKHGHGRKLHHCKQDECRFLTPADQQQMTDSVQVISSEVEVY